VKDEKGKWSLVHTQQLDNVVTPPTPAIVKAEFFVNNDPGYGLATNITIPTGQTTLNNISFNVPTSSLTGGTDYLFVRVKDEKGKWSLVHTQQLDNIVTPQSPQILEAEYFVDVDPGFGNGTNITIPNNLTILEDINFSLNTSSLSIGNHLLYIRTRDEKNRWSIVNITPFFAGEKHMFTQPLQTEICNGHSLNLKIYSDVAFSDIQTYTANLYTSPINLGSGIQLANGTFSIGEIQKIVSIIIPENLALQETYHFITQTSFRTGVPSQAVTLVDTCFNCPLIVSSEEDSGPNSLRYIVDCAPSGSNVTFSSAIDSVILKSPLIFRKNLSLQNSAPMTVYLDMTKDGFTGAEFGMQNLAPTLDFHNFSIHHLGNSLTKPILFNKGAGITLHSNKINGTPTSVIKNSNAGQVEIEGLVEIK
jgi:hypothetical protein